MIVLCLFIDLLSKSRCGNGNWLNYCHGHGRVPCLLIELFRACLHSMWQVTHFHRLKECHSIQYHYQDMSTARNVSLTTQTSQEIMGWLPNVPNAVHLLSLVGSLPHKIGINTDTLSSGSWCTRFLYPPSCSLTWSLDLLHLANALTG